MSTYIYTELDGDIIYVYGVSRSNTEVNEVKYRF